MKKNISIISAVILLLLHTGCTDEFEHPLLRDNQPEIPVTFTGSTTYGANPYYNVSLANGNISITLAVPESAPVKIKEITKIVGGGTGVTPGNVLTSGTGTLANYLTAPLAVNGTTAVFTTTIAEFNTRVAASARVTLSSIPAGGFAERAFMFLLTMEDDSTIIPVQCRIRITP